MASLLLHSLSELESQVGEIRWVVKGAIPAASVGTLFGGSGSFKTFVALDLALSVSWGLPWLGLKTEKGQVVYIAAEGGVGIFNRIRAWHDAHGLDWRQCSMRVITAPLALRSEAPIVSRAIFDSGLSPLLIFVDTLSQTYSGDENDAAEVASFYRQMVSSFVNKLRSTVILVHHTGHSNTERPRGSSAIVANSDFIYGLFRSEGSTLATLECQKQKDGSLLPSVSFRMAQIGLGRDSDGDPVTSLAAFHIADPAALAAAVGAGPDSAKKSILDIAAASLPVGEARKRFYADSDCETREAKKKQWQRTLAWATEAGLVQISDGLLLRNNV